MKKFLMILAGSVLLTTSAMASVHNQSRGGNRDNLPPRSCWKNTCTNHESLTSVQNSHDHMLKSKKLSRLDLEERRLLERSGRASFIR